MGRTKASGSGNATSKTLVGVTKSAPARDRVADTRRGGGIGQGDMYHIVAPKGHGQVSAPFGEYHPPGLASAYPPSLVELAAAVFAGVRGVEQERDLAGAGSGLDPFRAVDEVARARFHAEAVERRLVKTRRCLRSTTTVFERPWLKLCFTLPVSTVRLIPSGGRVPSFGLSGVSAILFLHI